MLCSPIRQRHNGGSLSQSIDNLLNVPSSPSNDPCKSWTAAIRRSETCLHYANRKADRIGLPTCKMMGRISAMETESGYMGRAQGRPTGGHKSIPNCNQMSPARISVRIGYCNIVPRWSNKSHLHFSHLLVLTRRSNSVFACCRGESRCGRPFPCERRRERTISMGLITIAS